MTAFTLGFRHFSTKSIFSPVMFLYSTRPASPKSPTCRSSIFSTIFPPVALSSLAMSSAETRLKASMWASAKAVIRGSLILFLQKSTLAPVRFAHSTIHLLNSFSNSISLRKSFALLIVISFMS